jgi:hypothetical protein
VQAGGSVQAKLSRRRIDQIIEEDIRIHLLKDLSADRLDQVFGIYAGEQVPRKFPEQLEAPRISGTRFMRRFRQSLAVKRIAGGAMHGFGHGAQGDPHQRKGDQPRPFRGILQRAARVRENEKECPKGAPDRQRQQAWSQPADPRGCCRGEQKQHDGRVLLEQRVQRHPHEQGERRKRDRHPITKSRFGDQRGRGHGNRLNIRDPLPVPKGFLAIRAGEACALRASVLWGEGGRIRFTGPAEGRRSIPRLPQQNDRRRRWPEIAPRDRARKEWPWPCWPRPCPSQAPLPGERP